MEKEIAQTVGDEDPFVILHPIEDVRAVAEDKVGPGVYGGMSDGATPLIHADQIVRTPVSMECEHDEIRVLFSFGNEGLRYMDQHATVMIHDVSSGGFGKIEELKADVKEAERLNKKLYYMMAENCGKNKTYFLKLALLILRLYKPPGIVGFALSFSHVGHVSNNIISSDILQANLLCPLH